jgi:hypothetical protein
MPVNCWWSPGTTGCYQQAVGSRQVFIAASRLVNRSRIAA